MSEQELLQAMLDAYFSASGPSDIPFGLEMSAMRAILDVLHKAGYRRCAEGQGTTQWCERANKAEAMIARLTGDLAGANRECEVRNQRELGYMARAESAEAEVKRLREDRDELISAVDTWHAEVKRLRGLLKADGDQQAAHIRGLNESWEAEREILVSEIERLTSEEYWKRMRAKANATRGES